MCLVMNKGQLVLVDVDAAEEWTIHRSGELLSGIRWLSERTFSFVRLNKRDCKDGKYGRELVTICVEELKSRTVVYKDYVPMSEVHGYPTWTEGPGTPFLVHWSKRATYAVFLTYPAEPSSAALKDVPFAQVGCLTVAAGSVVTVGQLMPCKTVRITSSNSENTSFRIDLNRKGTDKSGRYWSEELYYYPHRRKVRRKYFALSGKYVWKTQMIPAEPDSLQGERK